MRYRTGIFVAMLAVMTPLQAQKLPFACGPFLLQPRDNGMVVVVDHPVPTPAAIRWRAKGTDRHLEIRHAEPARHHIFDLERLIPDTTYEYRVSGGATIDSGPREFRTLPSAPERFRLLALGDVRTQITVWGQLSEKLFANEKDALFIIGTGDYPADGRLYEQWVLQFFHPARNLLASKPFWPAIGNHELTRTRDGNNPISESKFFSLFELPGNERWYRVDYSSVTLLVLDSNTPMHPGGMQYEFLRRQLRSKRRTYTLVAFHHSPFTSGPHARLMPDRTPFEWPIDHARRFLAPLFEMYRVDLVLTGHDHLYERSRKGGVDYIVTGGGGAPLYNVNTVPNPHQIAAASVYHYVALDVGPDKLVATAIDMEGREFDSLEIRPRRRATKRAPSKAAGSK